jgi:hypothetical protein
MARAFYTIAHQSLFTNCWPDDLIKSPAFENAIQPQAMQLPTSQPNVISQMLDNLTDVIRPLTFSERTSGNAADNPAELVNSLQQLRNIIQNNTSDALTGGEITEIGEYAMQLPDNTPRLLQRMNDVELQQQNGILAVSRACRRWFG